MRQRYAAAPAFAGFLISSILAAAPQNQLPAVDGIRRTVIAQPFYPPGYLELKIAAAAAERVNGLQFPPPVRTERQFGSVEPPMRHIVILSCELPESAAETSREWVLEIAARRVAEIRQTLPLYHYRREVYEEPILNYEREMIALADTASSVLMQDTRYESPDGGAGYKMVRQVFANERSLVREIDVRRFALQRRRPAIRYMTGCGAGGGSTYFLRTMPENGRVWMVPAFRFFYCQTQTLQPWDIQGCRGWREYHPDQPVHAEGRYMFQVLWADGVTRRGDRTFEPAGERPVTVTLRRN